MFIYRLVKRILNSLKGNNIRNDDDARIQKATCSACGTKFVTESATATLCLSENITLFIVVSSVIIITFIYNALL